MQTASNDPSLPPQPPAPPPEDVTLVRRIHRLLTIEGYTVRGVQQLLGRPAAAAADAAPPPVSETAPPVATSAAPIDTDQRRSLQRIRDMLAVALGED